MSASDVASTLSTGYQSVAHQQEDEAGSEARERIRPPPDHLPSETESEYDSDAWPTEYHETSETQAPEQLPRQSRTTNWKSVLIWSAVAIGIVALAGFIGWAIAAANSHDDEEKKEDKKKGSSWKEFQEQVPMIVNIFVIYIGSLRILNAGKVMSLDYFSQHDSRLGDFLRREDAGDQISLLASALIPTWATLLLLPNLGDGRCRDEWNVYRHLPAKTNKDVRAVLEVWWKFMSMEGRFIFGVAQSFKQDWMYSFRNMVTMAFALAGWAALEAIKGPCWTFTRVYWAWNPILTAIVVCYVVRRRDALFFKREIWPWTELVLFTWTMYIAWTSPLDDYCSGPKCW